MNRRRLAVVGALAIAIVGVVQVKVQSQQTNPPPPVGTDPVTNAVDVTTWAERIPVLTPVDGTIGGYVDTEVMLHTDTDPVPVYADMTGTVVVGYFHRGDAQAGDPGGFVPL